MSTAGPARTVSPASSPPGALYCPEATRPTRQTARRSAGWATPRTACSSPTSATMAQPPSPARSRSCPGCAPGAADGGGLGQPQHGRRAGVGRAGWPVRRRGRPGRGRPAGAGRQAQPGAVPGGGQATSGGAGPGGGGRGRPGRGGGGPARPVPGGRRGGPGRPGHRLAERGADLVVADLGQLTLEPAAARQDPR